MHSSICIYNESFPKFSGQVPSVPECSGAVPERLYVLSKEPLADRYCTTMRQLPGAIRSCQMMREYLQLTICLRRGQCVRIPVVDLLGAVSLKIVHSSSAKCPIVYSLPTSNLSGASWWLGLG